MISYKALTSASTIIEVIDDVSLYESEIFSTNGNILYPYDLDTTLTAIIFENFKDITDSFTDIRWTIFSCNSNNKEFDEQWNKDHIGKNPITITKEEIHGKAIIQFEAYKNFTGIPGDEQLVALDRITITDINDLLSTGIKPTDPYIGQSWIDTSTEPATMWIWNGIKWVQIGTVTAVVKNLIRNSAFSAYNYQYYDIVGDSRLSFLPVVKINNGKKWLNLVSEVESNEHRGIKQTTENTEKIFINSDYSFQFLVYNNSDDSNEIKINIYSLNSNKDKTLIYEDLYTIDNAIKHYFTSFKTLDDTTNIEVEILGLDGSKYNFYITELALYNTANIYPWEASPYDSEMIYDSEALFNALTYNGAIEGIYSLTDPVTGQVQYFFNASYINSGVLKGDRIDARELTVERSDGVKTLEIDKNGNVNLVVNSFKLASSNQTIEEFIANKLEDLDPNQLKYLLLHLNKDHEQINYEYHQYYNDDILKEIDYDGLWSEYLDEDMLNKAKEENDELINIKEIKFNADNTFSIKSKEYPNTFYLGEAMLGFTMLGMNKEDPTVTGAKLKKLLYYTHLAYEESFTDLVNTINALIEEKDFKTLSTEDDLNNNYADYSVKNALLCKLFLVCNDYITNKKITILTDEWSKIELDTKSIISEVGEIKSAYEGQTLLEAVGSIANEKITVDSIVNTVSTGLADPDKKEIAEKYQETILEQTSDAIGLEVNDYTNGLQSLVKVTNNGILLDSNGSLINMNGESIQLKSENINLEGYVTFNKLAFKEEGDTTVIDGGYIKTDSLDAKAIKANTLSANMITTGQLSNASGSSSFNLDDGTFKLGDKLIYDSEGNLSFSGITIKDSELDNSLPKWIQKWDTGQTFINGDEIVSPKAFFGTYEPESLTSLSGIFLGMDLDIRNTAGTEGFIDSGIVGYYLGESTFRFNLDGTAEFGRETDRQIKINTDGIMEVPTIYGDEISAYNLNVLKKDPHTKEETNISSLSVSDIGEISLRPSEFYLYNGNNPVITLNETKDTFIINADYITAGQMSAGCLNLKDGNLKVTDNKGNTTFSIDEIGNINISPSEFHLNSSTNGEVISLSNDIATINANYITVGELDGKLIKAESIESNKITIGDAVKGINNLTTNALFYKCESLEEKDNPSVIPNCTLGQKEYDYYYDYTINYSGNILDNAENVYIQVDLKQFYNITASKIYFKNDYNYYYNIKYSIDNQTWNDFNNEDIVWHTSNKEEQYTLLLNNNGVTARYLRLYLNGNDNAETNPSISSLSAWELYDGGVTTSIDASGIITGEISASRIAASSITTAHINISDNNFEFKNDEQIVFSINSEDGLSNKSIVTINPDNFILGNNDGNAIVLNSNELSINANFIKSGEINADLIKTGTLDANAINVKNLTGDQINGKGIVITANHDGKDVNTFEINEAGQIIVNESSFLIKNSENKNSTVQDLVNELDNKISKYIQMSGDQITLGKVDNESSYKTILNSEKLMFTYQDEEVASISTQKMNITNAEIKNNLTVGKNGQFFDFTCRSNGHLSLKWRDK